MLAAAVDVGLEIFADFGLLLTSSLTNIGEVVVVVVAEAAAAAAAAAAAEVVLK